MQADALYEKLIVWGADVAKARARLLEDDELYVSCLEDFAADKNFEMLKAAVREQKWKDAFEFAHAIKGVAANLGLTPIFNVSSQITDPLRAGVHEGIEERIAAMERIKEEYVSLING